MTHHLSGTEGLLERIRMMEARLYEVFKRYDQMNDALIQCCDELAREKARAEKAEHSAREMEDALKLAMHLNPLSTIEDKEKKLGAQAMTGPSWQR